MNVNRLRSHILHTQRFYVEQSNLVKMSGIDLPDSKCDSKLRKNLKRKYKVSMSEKDVEDNAKDLSECSRLGDSFFDVPCEELARKLLGKILARRLDDQTVLKGRVVETESYLGGDDKASMTYNGKVTERNKPLYMKPGTALVYTTYGMYQILNISSQGDGAGVLLRALEPIEGLDIMLSHRQQGRKTPLAKALPSHELCNGPAKLCTSLHIDKKSCNTQDLVCFSGMWVEYDEVSKEIEKSAKVVTTSRIGIDSVGPKWAKMPLRFYLLGNTSVSRVDKVQENELEEKL